MPLAPGTRVGPYEVITQIGEGGMGQVYRATDTTLGRQVALKVLPDAWASDAERVARFEREAKTLAALSHPNIAIVHGFERTTGASALVMELVEGDTLADRIAAGPLPPGDAVAIAVQIADALDAAHAQGIIHRDLKPANVKLRPDGAVKVLDFGLAKAIEPRGAPASGVSQSPTITSPAGMTAAGVILGTAAYMSPEQARGKAVDKRADVWAFGCVLYEMLTTRRAFGDEDVSLTISRVLRDDADLTALPPDVPARVRQTIVLCLQKDLKKRASDIHDVRLLLEGAFDTASPTAPAPRRVWPVAAAALIAAMISAPATWLLTSPPAPVPRVVRSTIPIASGQALTRPTQTSIGISADGSRLAYVANRQVYVRDLSAAEAEAIAGTDVHPAGAIFSPDGRWLAFYSGDRLMKIPVSGGAPIPISTEPAPAWGVRWSGNDTLLYASYRGISRVLAAGGTPELIVKRRGIEILDVGQLLPGGRAILFAWRGSGQRYQDATIVVQSLGSDERRVIWQGGSNPRYLPTGHLVFAHGNALQAVPFDAEAGEIRGTPVAVLTGISPGAESPDFQLGSPLQLAISDSGTVAYVPAAALPGGQRPRELVWVDFAGLEERIPIAADLFVDPRVSPDGTRIAVGIQGNNPDIFVLDLARGDRQRVTLEASDDRYPLWMPDGHDLLYSSNTSSDGLFSVNRKPADGSGVVTPLLRSADRASAPWSLAADRQTLLMSDYVLTGLSGYDLGQMVLGPGATRRPVLREEKWIEAQPVVSPDGRWLAYWSNESGRGEVYVRPFPDIESSKWQVSDAGGVEPVWSRDGRVLFYRTGTAIMSIDVAAGPAFRFSAPRRLFQGDYFNALGRQWDVSADGRRILRLKLIAGSDTSTPLQIMLIQDWFEELKRLVPFN
jgi:serine/threonine-protein kinase